MSESTREIRELEHLLRRLNHLLNLYTRRYLAGAGLTMARFWVLSNLLPSDKPVSMGEMQRRLSLAPATVTGLVDGLVKAGLVHRQRSNDDRRSVFLGLTPAGEKLLDKVFEYRISILETALEGQGNKAIGLLNTHLADIVSNLYDKWSSRNKGGKNRDACQNE